jgi:hypothetical protein
MKSAVAAGKRGGRKVDKPRSSMIFALGEEPVAGVRSKGEHGGVQVIEEGAGVYEVGKGGYLVRRIGGGAAAQTNPNAFQAEFEYCHASLTSRLYIRCLAMFFPARLGGAEHR